MASDPTAIVVTVPKSQQDYVLGTKFTQGSGYIYWRLPQLPRALEAPRWSQVSYRYFVWDGAVRSRFSIMDFIDKDGWPVWDLSPPNIDVPGPAVLLFATSHHRLEEPVPMKSFRGFRYYEPPDIGVDDGK